MIRIKWPLALATLFLMLLGWWLFYTQEVVQRVEENSALMAEMFAELQEGVLSEDLMSRTRALVEVQEIVRRTGLPLIVMGPSDTLISYANLPFEVDVESPESIEEVRAYVEVLDATHLPIGDPNFLHIHYGDAPAHRSIVIPWLQAGGLLLTVVVWLMVMHTHRRAEGERAWTAMARELAHQLGTPLSSLQGWLEVLKLPGPDRPADLADSDIATSIGEDLNRLERISHRFELIGREPDMESLSVRRVVLDLEHYLAIRIPRLAKKSVDLVVDVPRGMPKVQGNRVLLMWALENVVKNALDALAGRGGEISIYARAIGEKWVSLRIHDTGTGVDPDVRDKIFEPGVSSKTSGWGVGLALSRRIIEGVHGGRIELLEASEGTTFEINLPTADA